jgi:hypothetical protein
MGFVFGIVSHWTSLVAYKESKDAKPTIIFLDSRTTEVLDWDETEIDWRIN